MCDCRHCGRWGYCGDGSCPNDICPDCEQEREDARAAEAVDRQIDQEWADRFDEAFGPMRRMGQ
jgi:hypothetical protein